MRLCKVELGEGLILVGLFSRRGGSVWVYVLGRLSSPAKVIGGIAGIGFGAVWAKWTVCDGFFVDSLGRTLVEIG